jgi:RNA polymerase sigma-54 factor
VDQRLSLKLGQRLVLTPTLQQAIRLLQLSKIELIEEVRAELEENPVLEELPYENPLSTPQEIPASARIERETEEEPQPMPAPEQSPFQSDLDWGIYNDQNSYEGPSGADDSREATWYENVLTVKQSLREYLSWQLHLTIDREDEIAAGEEIIGNIDDDGYLRVPPAEIAAALTIPVETVERALSVIQSFDPPGVGASDIRECLLLQIRRLPEPQPLAETIIRDHLKKLETRNLSPIAHALHRPIAEVAEAARVVAGLEPKPGRLFSNEEPQYIIPDLFISKDGDEYVVSLNDEGLPKLRISSYYRRLMSDRTVPEGTREYIQKKFSSAVWLVKSIHQRQKTIFRVAESIVRHQRDFLDRGIEHLKPMILRTVAEDIGVHESTVSRVTTRKYAQTPQGLFELKFFFNTGIDGGAGGSMASVSVQNLIQKMVGGEDVAHPLSDDEIARRLRSGHGLIIARRTVAKYRGIMRIPPANRRRNLSAGGTR